MKLSLLSIFCLCIFSSVGFAKSQEKEIGYYYPSDKEVLLEYELKKTDVNTSSSKSSCNGPHQAIEEVVFCSYWACTVSYVCTSFGRY